MGSILRELVHVLELGVDLPVVHLRIGDFDTDGGYYSIDFVFLRGDSMC